MLTKPQATHASGSYCQNIEALVLNSPLRGTVKENKKSVGTTIVPIIWSKHSVSQVQVLITLPNRPLGFSCGLFGYKQANYYKSEVRKLVHGTNYYSSGWRLKGLTHNPERERDGPCPCSAESGITGRTKDVMLLR